MIRAMMTANGAISGAVTWRTWLSQPAPSTRAAS
jgi:hypothetical protein